MRTELFPESADTALERAVRDCIAFRRSTMICPRDRSTHPKTGIFESSFLKTQWSGCGIETASARESTWLTWFDMKTYALSRPTRERPRVSTVTPKTGRRILE